MVRSSAHRVKDLVARRSKALLSPLLERASHSSAFSTCEVLPDSISAAAAIRRRTRGAWGHGISGHPLIGFMCAPARWHSNLAARLILSPSVQLPARENWEFPGIARIFVGRCQGHLALQVRSMADQKLIKYYKKPPTPRQLMKEKKRERQMAKVRKAVAVKTVWKTREYVELVQSILREKGWGEKTIQSLEPISIALNTRRVALILKKVQNPIVALRFFWWSGLQEGCKLTLNLYCDMIKMLIDRGMYQEMWSLLESKQPEAEKLTKLVFAPIMKSYGQREDGEKEALRTYERLKDLEYFPDVIAYNSLLHILVRARDHVNTRKVFKDMLKEDRVPNVTTYNTIMLGLLLEGDSTEVLNVFEKMKDSGCTPNLSSFNHRISAYINLNRFEEALDVVEEMKERSIMPDSINCIALIYHHIRIANLDEALQLLREMRQNGSVRINISLYCTLIRSLCEARRVDDATSLLEEMLAIGLERQIHTQQMANLIHSFSNAGARQVADKLNNLMSMRTSPSELPTVKADGPVSVEGMDRKDVAVC